MSLLQQQNTKREIVKKRDEVENKDEGKLNKKID